MTLWCGVSPFYTGLCIRTHVWCMYVLVPTSHTCVCNVHTWDWVCATRR